MINPSNSKSQFQAVAKPDFMAVRAAYKGRLACGASGMVKISQSQELPAICGSPLTTKESGAEGGGALVPLCGSDHKKFLQVLTSITQPTGVEIEMKTLAGVGEENQNGDPKSTELGDTEALQVLIDPSDSENQDATLTESSLLRPSNNGDEKIQGNDGKQTWLQRLKGLSMPTKVALGVGVAVVGLGSIVGLACGLSSRSSAKENSSDKDYATGNQTGVELPQTTAPNAEPTTVKTITAKPLSVSDMKLYIKKPENCQKDISVYHGEYVAHTFKCDDFGSSDICQLNIVKMQEGKQITVDFDADKKVAFSFNRTQPCISFRDSSQVLTSSNCKAQDSNCFKSVPQICDDYRVEFDVEHCNNTQTSYMTLISHDKSGKNSVMLGSWRDSSSPNQGYSDGMKINRTGFSRNSEQGSASLTMLGTSIKEVQGLKYSLNGQLQLRVRCKDGNPEIALTNTGNCSMSQNYNEKCINN